MRGSVALTLAAAVGTAAVVGAVASTPVPDNGAQARVVVAVPDSASNPYHDFFHAQPSQVTPELLEEFGVDEDHVLHLTRTGDWADDFATDADLWDEVVEGELYWIAGTNLLGISFDADGIPLVAEEAESSHGIGTTAAVMMANPEAIVVAVEGTNSAAESWAFSTPWVDLVSTSYGFPGSVPMPGHVTDSYTGVVEGGKIHVGAADNTPALSPLDTTSGPWWSLAVAGLHEDDGRNREGLSGNLIDFVSDFTQDLPYCSRCEDGTRFVSGTSFATPRIAGTISKILLDARRAAGQAGGIVLDGVDQPTMVLGKGLSITNWELRRALEEAAWYPSAQDGSLTGGDFGTYPVPSQAPWTVAGWGLVSPASEFDVVEQAEMHLDVLPDDPTRFKSAVACDFMTSNMEARYVYWDNLNLASQSRGQAERPYLPC